MLAWPETFRTTSTHEIHIGANLCRKPLVPSVPSDMGSIGESGVILKTLRSGIRCIPNQRVRARSLRQNEKPYLENEVTQFWIWMDQASHSAQVCVSGCD